MSKKNGLDQYYTKPDVALWCLSHLKKVTPLRFVIEPSAGQGAFTQHLTCPFLAVDLDPQYPGVIGGDFFDLSFVGADPKEVVVLGNPPFGFASSLAVKFFNHAAQFGSVIAFIVPKTFRKESIQRKLDLRFHLALDVNTPKNSFLLDGAEYDVPCCFQVWVMRAPARVLENIKPLFRKVTKDKAQVAVRRAGGRAGQVLGISDFDKYSDASTLFLEETHPGALKALCSNKYTVPEAINHTAGVRSVTINEISKRVLEIL